MKKYSLKSIMHSAWSIYRKAEGITFAAALRMAWANAKTYNEARAAAGTAEVTHTWAGWKNLGYEVIHESKALGSPPISENRRCSSSRHKEKSLT